MYRRGASQTDARGRHATDRAEPDTAIDKLCVVESEVLEYLRRRRIVREYLGDHQGLGDPDEATARRVPRLSQESRPESRREPCLRLAKGAPAAQAAEAAEGRRRP